KILCLAKNFVAHAREFGAEAPKEPIFFAKLPDTLLPHGGDVVIPHWLDTRVDHEAELGLVLGFADPGHR
ncbi:MAG: fumarylacetoacetate hydrolase family protein, partial [Planctomycetota bacterium]